MSSIESRRGDGGGGDRLPKRFSSERGERYEPVEWGIGGVFAIATILAGIAFLGWQLFPPL